MKIKEQKTRSVELHPNEAAKILAEHLHLAGKVSVDWMVEDIEGDSSSPPDPQLVRIILTGTEDL